MNTVVIQSYGGEYEYKRAIFLIWSLYAHTASNDIPVLVFTDNPGYFRRYCDELPVEIVTLTSEMIKEMRGEIDFVHRVKIKIIQKAFQLTHGNILYIDSDTFFICDPQTTFDQVSASQAFMHVNEYIFRQLKDLEVPAGRTFHIFYDFVTGQKFYLSDGSVVIVSADQISWNAGVIFLHRSHEILLADVLKLTDDFYPFTQNNGCEQYAFSIVLERFASVQPCDDIIYHYWIVVKKQIADIFFETRITDEWSKKSCKEKITIMKLWTQKLPDFLDDHPKMLRYNAIQAFCSNSFRKGLKFAFWAILKEPGNREFHSDVLYYLMRWLKIK
jgi:hypothetical protein